MPSLLSLTHESQFAEYRFKINPKSRPPAGPVFVKSLSGEESCSLQNNRMKNKQKKYFPLLVRGKELLLLLLLFSKIIIEYLKLFWDSRFHI
jgi:hypothetical protein